MLADRSSNEEMASEVASLAQNTSIKLEDDTCPLVAEEARVS
jgi:hypothetical protein